MLRQAFGVIKDWNHGRFFGIMQVDGEETTVLLLWNNRRELDVTVDGIRFLEKGWGNITAPQSGERIMCVFSDDEEKPVADAWIPESYFLASEQQVSWLKKKELERQRRSKELCQLNLYRPPLALLAGKKSDGGANGQVKLTDDLAHDLQTAMTTPRNQLTKSDSRGFSIDPKQD